MPCAIRGSGPDIGSIISGFATPTEYAKDRQAPISVITPGCQQTQALWEFVRNIDGLCDVSDATFRDRLPSPA